MLTLIDSEIECFLILSGYIPERKENEFEQTFRLAAEMITKNCISLKLMRDTSYRGRYFFFSLWTDENMLKRFMESPEYQLVNGAFQVLGDGNRVITGNISEKKSQRMIEFTHNFLNQ